MTSINALRLDNQSGLLVCDEARYWNPEWMIFYTPEKIRSIIRDDITKHFGIVMFMGQTGTSSIGDEWIAEVTREIAARYDSMVKSCGGIPEKFMTLQELSRFVFEIITRIKTDHLNDFLKGKYGFTLKEFIKGSYKCDQTSYKITDQDFIRKVMKYVQFEGNPDEVKGIFGNSQVLGGYAPADGFRMFYMTERWPVCEEIREIFLAQGSGRDTCDLVYSRFADTRKLTERKGRDTIHRASGLYTLLKGLNTAMNLTAGVGGYPKIIYIDAKRKNRAEWISEICDMRSRLAAEIVSVAEEGFITVDSAENLLEDLIFKRIAFEKINQALFDSVSDPTKLLRFLRGYTL
jgi:hypothetical protein